MRVRTVVAATAALVMLIGAQDQQSAKSLADSLNQVEEKKDQVQRKIDRVNRDKKVVKRDIRAVDYQLTRVAGELDKAADMLDEATTRQEELANELTIAGELVAERKQLVQERLRTMYRQVDANALIVLVGAESVGDFAARKSLLEKIARRDRELFDDLLTLKEEIAGKKREQDELVDHVSGLLGIQEQKQNELEDVQQEKREVLSDLERRTKDLERQFREWENKSRELAARIAAIQRSKEGTDQELTYSGKMIMPASGRYTGQFGMRNHPILRKRKMHNGVDIAAPSRSTIKAAAAGSVMTVGWISGYGNTVTIDHGSGISTLYAHCSSIYVKAGQYVEAGQRIAAVGATGLATGPHLHFEVRVNGKPVNPRNYLP